MMGTFGLVLLLCLTWNMFLLGTCQLQSSQAQVLLQLKKHLEYPKQLEMWYDRRTDFCSLASSPHLNITCNFSSVTGLRIMGDKHVKLSELDGFSLSNQTLSERFSMDSFVTTLSRLTGLRALSLVSLGIWGPLPDKIHRLSSLEYLDLSSNFLFGSIPPKISTMVRLQTVIFDDNFLNDTVPGWFNSLSNLTVLSLRNNRLNGRLPDLSSLSKLRVLDLSSNNLDSKLPTLPKGLLMAFLSNNSFSGEIDQKQYSWLSKVQHIDISSNRLSGTPPAALFSLPNISYLNLASNMLSGSLPSDLQCGSKLEFVDISNNRFTGEVPSCLSSEPGKTVVKLGGNCLSIDIHHQHAESYCIDTDTKGKHSGGRNIGVLVGLVVAIFAVGVLLAFGFLVVFRSYCARGISEQHLLHKSVQDNLAAGFSSELLTNARFISEAAKMGTEGIPACRQFTLEELMEATNSFHNSTIIGEGSYGKLYKGRLENGTQVAIRCLPSSKKFTIRNLKLRLDLLARLRHPHLVYLLGHCMDNGGRDDYNVNKVFLVYEYMPNGNFSTHLSETNPGKILSWPERLAVLLGVAKAVHFLHTGVIPGFFNNKLKTHNILLNQHQLAKLSDYGLAIISEDNNHHEAKGDHLNSWQMTKLEDDIFSFGFILLESLVGPLVSAKREMFLRDELASFDSQEGRIKVVNPTVLATCSQESLSIVISVMKKCIVPESSSPSFEDILWNLQYAAQIQATADGDQRFNNAS